MKSKIITNSKRKIIAFVATVIIILMIIVAIMSNCKESELTIGKLSTNRMASTSVTDEELGESSETAKYYNTNLKINIDTQEDDNTKNIIRYVELQKKNSKGKWETYTKNGLTYKYMLGDVDNNGKIDEYDAALIWGYLAGENDLTALQKIVADINGDGIINKLDYQIILYSSARYTANGESYHYYIGNPKIDTDTNSTSNIDGRKGFKITAEDAKIILRLCFGLGSDVNGNDIDINDNLSEDNKKKILVAKMLSDYDGNGNGKIKYEDAELYLKAAANLSADDSRYKEMQALAKKYGKVLDISDFNLETARKTIINSIQASLNLCDQVENISYNTNNFVKFNTSNIYFPELEDEGEYKLITYRITSNSVKLTNVSEMMDNESYRSTLEYYFIIDKTFPTYNISYSPSEPTNKNVTATITFNEEVKSSLDSAYSTQQTVEFSENGMKNVTYYDKAGNSKEIDLNVTWIDRTKPVLIDYTSERSGSNITVTAIFDEEISNVDNFELKIKIGENTQKGSIQKEISSNQVIFKYTILETEGGNIEMTLSGKVADKADNESDDINQAVGNNNDSASKTVIKVNTHYYEFTKNGDLINDLSEKTYFVKGDTIGVIELEYDGKGNFSEKNEYKYTLNDEVEDNSHIRRMQLYKDTKKAYFSSNFFDVGKNISDANIYFDTVSPTISVKVGADAPNEKNTYKQGTTLKISASASEELLVLIDPESTPTIGDETEIIPQINVSFSDSGLGKYNYQTNTRKGNAKFVDVTKEDGKAVWNYIYEVQNGDTGDISISYANDSTIIYDNAYNFTVLSNTPNNVDTGNIKIDTTAPTVKISAKNLDTNTVIENGVTNASKIEYSFKWSEEVSGFTIDDLTIINGTAEELIQDETDKTLYKLIVKNDIADGNNGTIKIIVNRDAVNDDAGYSNERYENEIRVDRQSAILIGLEAYAESNIKLNTRVDNVKKYYKIGDSIKIVATFTENINLVEKAIPDLALEFSNSGNAKANVSGKLDGNKLIYTYKISQGDNGELSVKGFTGEVIDTVGNETKVTKRNLDGDTIIADTIAPKLNELKITSPNKGNCKGNDVITVEAIFNEKVYALKNNEINNVTKETAPIVNIKIGNSENIGLTFSKYGTTDGKTDKTKLIYTYEIRAEEKDNQGKIIYNGDNGEVKISEVKNASNAQVCDIAGNAATLTVKQTGNKINVDTVRPYVTNISAKVENPSILNTNPYHKEGNDIKITLTFSEKVSSAKIFPEILVGFSESENAGPANYNTYSYESDWNVDSTTVEYTYEISDGDNGYLWVGVPENQFADAAGNGNIAKDAIQLKSVFADTKRPTLTILEKTEVSQNNQSITVKATFSENVFDLDGDSRISLSNDKAPKLVYSFGDGNNKEVNASNVSGSVITYVVKKDSVNDNGTFMPLFVKGNLYDRAGNPYYIEETDTTAPILQSVIISSNADDKYKTSEQDNCKEGTEIYVTAIFDENIAKQNMKLKFKIGEGAEQEISGNIDSNDKNEVVFKYTVKKGDNGTFTIIDVIGNTNKDITEEGKDNTYGYVQDEFGNQANIYNFDDVKISGKVVADTIIPYVTSIVAKVGETEIASYTKENNAVLVGRTNANSIKYIVTMSEDILYNHFDRISVTNGIITNIEQTNTNEFTIEVQATTEGVQSLILPEGVTEDKAGNLSEFLRMDGVTNDFTVPTVRFISEYNGGEYVLPTNIGKIEIRPNIEINEDISKVEYKWDDEDYTQIKDYSSSSDIAIPTKSFDSAGKHTLYIKVKDLAGNIAEAYKVYNIYNSEVEFEYNEEYTNKDLEVKIDFETGLTDNRKVLFKANNSNDIVQLNAVGTDGDKIKYSISENGILYAEATDRVGNKVFNQITISNIDKENPVIGLETNGGNLVIGTDKEKATIKSIINVEEENLKSIEYAITTIDTSVENVTPENLKANMELNFTSIENYSEAKIENADEGTYYMYVIATDKAGNTTILKSNKFVVANSNEQKDEEGNVTYTPTKENTISFEREKSIVYVNFGVNLSENQSISLTNDEDGIVYDTYAEILKNTIITATAEDVCGNIVKATYTVENVEGPKFDVVGDLETWVNTDIELTVVSYEELSALTVNGEDILKNNMKVVIKENGEYTFKATDIYGNSTEKVVKVSNIDKVKPVISKTETKGNNIIITASDELSGICEYAVTKTTEVPVEWSSSNTISTTKDGSFYVWAKDNAGNVTVGENTIVVDTTAPTITFEYLSLTVTVGMPIESNIKTNESAKISYSWDNKTWTESKDLVTSIKVSEKSTKPGKYTLYAKATDAYGNTSDVNKVEFSVENVEDIRQPEIIFEDLATVQVNGVKYVKVSSNMTKELLTDKMSKTALCGVSPEYKNLTEDGKLKTGSEILLNGETKYIIAVKGDINGDGKAGDFIEDIITLNRYRINGSGLTTAQMLAGDINNDGKIDFIDDVMQINRYRIGIISIL